MIRKSKYLVPYVMHDLHKVIGSEEALNIWYFCF